MWESYPKIKKFEGSTDLTTSSESEEEPPVMYDFWQHHKEFAFTQKKKKSYGKGDETSLYLSNPVCNLKSNPLEEWEDMKYIFPLLYKEA